MIEQLFAPTSSMESLATGEAQKAQTKRTAVKIPSMSRLSISQFTTNRWSFAKDLVAYRELGFEAAGLSRAKVTEFDEASAVGVVRRLGMAVSSLSFAGGFTGANDASFSDAVADARHALHLAAQLGSDSLILVSGPQGHHIASHARRLVIEALKALSADSARTGVALALQPQCDPFCRNESFLKTLDQTIDVIQRSEGRGRIAFDVYQLWREPRLLQRIAEFAPFVAVVQLSDAVRNPRCQYDRRLPGDGQLPLTEIVSAFDEAGYGGYYELAVWSEELWRADYRALLRDCRNRFDVHCRPHSLPSAQ